MTEVKEWILDARLRCVNVQVLRCLCVRYVSIPNQANILKLERPRKPSSTWPTSSSIKTLNSVSPEPDAGQ